MRRFLFTITLVAGQVLSGNSWINAAPPTPSSPSVDAPIDPRTELAQLRNMVRKALPGSFAHTGNRGACAILPHPDRVDWLWFRNEHGDYGLFCISDIDPFHLIHLTGGSQGWDTPDAYVQLAPDGVIVQFKHHDRRRNDSWASIRK